MAESIVIKPRRRQRKPLEGPSPYRFMSWSLADVMRNSELIYCREQGIETYKPTRRSCLYVMVAGDFIKVGVTVDPMKRQYDLQVANPMVVTLHKAYLPPEDINILRIEMIAHRALKQFHVRGEWFRAEALSLFRSDAP